MMPAWRQAVWQGYGGSVPSGGANLDGFHGLLVHSDLYGELWECHARSAHAVQSFGCRQILEP